MRMLYTLLGCFALDIKILRIVQTRTLVAISEAPRSNHQTVPAVNDTVVGDQQTCVGVLNAVGIGTPAKGKNVAGSNARRHKRSGSR